MINAKDIEGMIDHWLRTKPNGYRGSSYGAPLEELRLNAQTASVANEFIAKMKRDIPILNQLSSDQFGVFFSNVGFETRRIALKVGTIQIDLSTVDQNSQSSSGDTYNANAK